jgi:dihydroceramidase
VPYIAEFWNTITNLIFLFLSGYGMVNIFQSDLERRFLLQYASLFLIGLGSWLFHMTLVFEMQMLDELPMLYCTCVLIYNLLEMHRRNMYGMWLKLFLVVDAVGLTAAYLRNKNPLFHQVTYGLQTTFILIQSIRLTTSLSKATKQQVYTARYVLSRGWMMYIVGFVFWVIDNHYCMELREWRQSMGAGGVMLQFHGWWHVLTGLGSYWIMVFIEYMRKLKIEDDDYTLVFRLGGLVPSVMPVLRELNKLD